MMHDIGSDMHRNERNRNTNDRKEHPQYNKYNNHTSALHTNEWISITKLLRMQIQVFL